MSDSKLMVIGFTLVFILIGAFSIMVCERICDRIDSAKKEILDELKKEQK